MFILSLIVGNKYPSFIKKKFNHSNLLKNKLLYCIVKLLYNKTQIIINFSILFYTYVSISALMSEFFMPFSLA